MDLTSVVPDKLGFLKQPTLRLAQVQPILKLIEAQLEEAELLLEAINLRQRLVAVRLVLGQLLMEYCFQHLSSQDQVELLACYQTESHALAAELSCVMHAHSDSLTQPYSG